MGRKGKIAAGLVAAVLLLAGGPVAIEQLRPDDPPRPLRGVSLAETRYEPVRFRNQAQDLALAGMLFVPEGEGPFPVVVAIHGSGTSVRDNAWYLSFAQGLQARGIAVLLPDKRGSEQSGGDWRDASFDDLASDTQAAVDYLRTRHGDRFSAIGLAGFSQGGHIAPIVASRSDDVRFVANVVGSSLPMHRLLRYEETHNLRELGMLPGVSDAVAYASSLWVRKLAQPRFWDAVGDFDPLPYWRRVEVPVLVLYGAEDTNVPTRASAERLRGLGKPNLRVVVFEGSGHALEDPPGRGDRLVRAEAIDALAGFVHAAVGRQQGG